MYWDKRQMAKKFPREFVSLINDGMQQNHLHCPQEGSSNSQLTQNAIKVSLQGSAPPSPEKKKQK